jgi:subtilisin-like proprotein convertase family protein
VIPPAPPGTTLATTAAQSSVAVVIDAVGTPTVTSTIQVSGAGPVLRDLDVATTLRFENSSDLQVALNSPAGTVVTLVSNPVNEQGLVFDRDDVLTGTLWHDQANPGGTVPYVTNAGLASDDPYVAFTLASPLAPVEALGAFRGEDPNGTSTLAVQDDRSDVGFVSFEGWSLRVEAAGEAVLFANGFQ